MFEVLGTSLRDERRSLAWWSGVTALLAFLITLVYPTYRDQASAFEQFWREAPEFLRAFFGEEFSFGTPEGFLSAEIYSTMAPLVFTIFAIGAGSRAIAGEERNGTLELLLAQPVARHRIVLEKFAAVTIAVLALAIALTVALLLGAAVAGMAIDPWRLAGMTLLTAMLGLAFGSIALLIGATFRGKGRAVGVAAGLGIATFLLNGLAPMVEWLEPFGALSPWHWFARGAPLLHGVSWVDLGVLAAIPLVAVVVAARGFERRDVAV